MIDIFKTTKSYELTRICSLLLLVVMDYLILVGHLHILILHVITATQQEK